MRFYMLSMLLIAGLGVIPLQSQEPKAKEQLISLDVHGKPFGEILGYIMKETGQKIVYDGDVQNVEVTLRVINVSWRAVIEISAKKYGCIVEELAGGVIKVSKPPTITMEFVGANLCDIINQIATIANKNIVISEGVCGQVSLRFKNVPWKDALASIVKIHGYALVEEAQGGILRVVLSYTVKPLESPSVKGLEVWIVELSSLDPEVKVQAAQELGKLGPQAAPAVPTLIFALQDQDAAVKKAAAQALEKIGKRLPSAITVPKDQGQGHKLRSALISMDVRAKPLSEILQGIIDQTGKNLYFNDATRGSLVSMKLHDVPWHRALAILARKYHWVVNDIEDITEVYRPYTVTLQLEGIDIRDAIRQIAAIANKNIILSEKVQGKVRLSGRNILLQDALEIIVRDAGYLLLPEREKRILRVISSQELQHPPVTDIGKWIVQLSDWQSELKIKAACELGNLDIVAAPAVPTLLFTLQDPDSPTRRFVAEALGKIGDKVAIPALAKALQDPDDGVQCAAAVALMRIGKKWGDAQVELLRTLKDQDIYVRGIAMDALERIGEKTIPMLVNALQDQDKYVRWGAAIVLGKLLGATLSAQGNMELTHQQTTDLDLGGIIFFPELPQYSVAFINNNIVRKGDPVVEFYIHKIQEGEVILRKQEKMVSLQLKRGQQTVYVDADRLRAILEESLKESIFRDDAIEACIAIGQKAVPILINALQDQDIEIRQLAVEALGKMGNKAGAAIPALEKATQDQDEHIRQVAAQVLEKIK